MSDTRQHAHELIDQLPSPHLHAVVGLLEAILDPVSRAFADAPLDDEPVTDEDIAAVNEGRAELARGEGISHADILREFGIRRG